MTAADSTYIDDEGTGGTGGDPLVGLPGHPMMWILILSELAVFGIGFVGFAIARLLDPAGFAAGQAHLNPTLGGLNTIILVTSGCLAAIGVAAAHGGLLTRARALFGAAAAVGLLFLVVKAMEYGATLDAGFTVNSGGFFTLYFLLTGFHALHVVMGMVVLVVVAFDNRAETFETGAAFWHMIDLVWIVLYPLMYLLR